MGSTVSRVEGERVESVPPPEEEVGGGLLWRLGETVSYRVIFLNWSCEKF